MTFEALAERIKKRFEDEENAILYADEILRRRLEELKAETPEDFRRRIQRLITPP